MKTAVLILGVALFIIGLQDAIRILFGDMSGGLFSWVPGGISLHVAIDVILVITGAMLARKASDKKPKSN